MPKHNKPLSGGNNWNRKPDKIKHNKKHNNNPWSQNYGQEEESSVYGNNIPSYKYTQPEYISPEDLLSPVNEDGQKLANFASRVAVNPWKRQNTFTPPPSKLSLSNASQNEDKFEFERRMEAEMKNAGTTGLSYHPWEESILTANRKEIYILPNSISILDKGNVIYLVLTNGVEKYSVVDYELVVNRANSYYSKMGITTRVIKFNGEIENFNANSIQTNESFAVIGGDKEDVINGLRIVSAEPAFINTVVNKVSFGSPQNPEITNAINTKSGIAISELGSLLWVNNHSVYQGVNNETFISFLILHSSLHNTGFLHGAAKKSSGLSLYGLEADGTSVGKSLNNKSLNSFEDLFITDWKEINPLPKNEFSISRYQRETIFANKRTILALETQKFGKINASPSIDIISGKPLSE